MEVTASSSVTAPLKRLVNTILQSPHKSPPKKLPRAGPNPNSAKQSLKSKFANSTAPFSQYAYTGSDDSMEEGQENYMTPPNQKELDKANMEAIDKGGMAVVKEGFNDIHETMGFQKEDMAHSAKLHLQARHTMFQTMRALTKAEEVNAQKSFAITGLKFSSAMKHEELVKGYQEKIEQFVKFPPKCQDDVNRAEVVFMGYREKALNNTKTKASDGQRKEAPVDHCKIGITMNNPKYVAFLLSYFYEGQEGGMQQLNPLFEEGKDRFAKKTANESGGKPFLLPEVRIHRILPSFAEDMCKFTGQVAYKMRKHKKNLDKKGGGYPAAQQWMANVKINTVGSARQHIVLKRQGFGKSTFIAYDDLTKNELSMPYCPRDVENKKYLANQPPNVVGRTEEVVLDEVNFHVKPEGEDVIETEVPEHVPDSPNTIKTKMARLRAKQSRKK